MEVLLLQHMLRILQKWHKLPVAALIVLLIIVQMTLRPAEAFQMQHPSFLATRLSPKLASTLQDYPPISAQNGINKLNRPSRSRESISTVIKGICSLYEIIDDEVLNSVVTFSDNGDLYFIETSQRDDLQGISGSWSIVNSSLRMVVDRTFKVQYNIIPITHLYCESQFRVFVRYRVDLVDIQ